MDFLATSAKHLHGVECTNRNCQRGLVGRFIDYQNRLLRLAVTIEVAAQVEQIQMA